ncbi:MAG: thioesterase family protein [Actinomycetota bacterium]
MPASLAPGARHGFTVKVTAEMTPSHLRPLVVLSTPEMIRLMEEASTQAVQSALEEEGRTTVGTHVDVSHESAAGEGEEVMVEAVLVAIDGPRLTFEVEARIGDRIVGRGTHRRHVVDRSRFSR